MKRLHFTYEMLFEFSEPVRNHRFTLKCIPESNACQRVECVDCRIEPVSKCSESRDSFGNREIYGIVEESHSSFHVKVEGTVFTGPESNENALPPHRLGIFKYPSGYTKPGRHLKEYMASLSFAESWSAYDKGIFLMHKIYEDFVYEKGVTTFLTTAEEAMRLGRGVCQDYAHILIALLRMLRIPARYVVGMMIGEGFSHAWVEMESEGKWYGLDATNNMLVDDNYIKISHGRDYDDCVVNKGVFTGMAKQKQDIRVIVCEEQRSGL